jgi:PilZ domain
MRETRKVERARAILGAHIIFNNRNSTIDCQIRNISRVGAKLVLSSSVSLPDEFDIDVPQKGKVYRARLCWRDETSAGIEFVLDATEANAEADHKLRVAQLETENNALRLRVLELTQKLETAMAASEARDDRERAA